MGSSILGIKTPKIPPQSISPPPPILPAPRIFDILTPPASLLEKKKKAASEGTSQLLIPILNNPL